MKGCKNACKQIETTWSIVQKISAYLIEGNSFRIVCSDCWCEREENTAECNGFDSSWHWTLQRTGDPFEQINQKGFRDRLQLNKATFQLKSGFNTFFLFFLIGWFDPRTIGIWPLSHWTSCIASTNAAACLLTPSRWACIDEERQNSGT